MVKYYVGKDYPYDSVAGSVVYRVRDNVEYLHFRALTWTKDEIIDVSFLREISIDEYIKSMNLTNLDIHADDGRKVYMQFIKLMAFWDGIDV